MANVRARTIERCMWTCSRRSRPGYMMHPVICCSVKRGVACKRCDYRCSRLWWHRLCHYCGIRKTWSRNSPPRIRHSPCGRLFNWYCNISTLPAGSRCWGKCRPSAWHSIRAWDVLPGVGAVYEWWHAVSHVVSRRSKRLVRRNERSDAKSEAGVV